MSIQSALHAGEEFELALSPARLHDIVANKTRYVDLAPYDAYERLSSANKRALSHLVRVAEILDKVFLKQDHQDNIRAKEILEAEAARGDKPAIDALTVFMTQNGVTGSDMYAAKTVPLQLFKSKTGRPGRNATYPDDLTKEELIEYVVAHPEQAASIFSNNTVVERKGDRLLALPYSVAFRDEMESAARELLAAAAATDHKGLAKYLRWQSQALVNDSDPVVVFNAEKAWIGVRKSPLEFTISRESYEEMFSADVAADPRVAAILKENGIIHNQKDSIGIRVGIVNPDADKMIAVYRDQIGAFSRLMPFVEEYGGKSSAKINRMIFTDVDLIALAGNYAAMRGGLTIAQNLPNGDKLSAKLGIGSRLVFHRQYRSGTDPEAQKHFLDILIDPKQRGFYNHESSFLLAVGHEIAHSIGPETTRDKRPQDGALGKWGSIIEESKADIASIVMADYLVSIGKVTPQIANQIYLTWAADELPARQPSNDEAHRMRSIVQLNYFREHGAISFEKGGKLTVIPEKFPVTAKQLLAELIELQLSGSPANAQTYVERHSAWNEALQYAVDVRMDLNPRQYILMRQPIRERLLTKDI